MDLDFVTVHKNTTTKFGQYPAIWILAGYWPNFDFWSIPHMNIFHADPYKSSKGRQNRKIYFFFLVIWFI